MIHDHIVNWVDDVMAFVLGFDYRNDIGDVVSNIIMKEVMEDTLTAVNEVQEAEFWEW